MIADVDECISNREQCHRRSTSCRNEQGGYACDCKPGFDRYTEFRCKGYSELRLPVIPQIEHFNA